MYGVISSILASGELSQDNHSSIDYIGMILATEKVKDNSCDRLTVTSSNPGRGGGRGCDRGHGCNGGRSGGHVHQMIHLMIDTFTMVCPQHPVLPG